MMDMLTIAHRTLGVVRLATKAEAGKNVALGMARGVATAHLRPQPAGVRMVLSVADGAAQARQAHHANLGVQLLDAAYEAVGMLRRA